jgi:hypothetical protein
VIKAARRNYEAASRKVSGRLNMWPVCTHPRCRRARRCNGSFGGETLYCFRDLPAETKLFVDKLSEVMAKGGSFEEAKEVATTTVLDLRRNREMDQFFKETLDYGREVLGRIRKQIREDDEEEAQAQADKDAAEWAAPWQAK